jgi:hypothetical protein
LIAAYARPVCANGIFENKSKACHLACW